LSYSFNAMPRNFVTAEMKNKLNRYCRPKVHSSHDKRKRSIFASELGINPFSCWDSQSWDLSQQSGEAGCPKPHPASTMLITNDPHPRHMPVEFSISIKHMVALIPKHARDGNGAAYQRNPRVFNRLVSSTATLGGARPESRRVSLQKSIVPRCCC
jgi:hypothetical protein